MILHQNKITNSVEYGGLYSWYEVGGKAKSLSQNQLLGQNIYYENSVHTIGEEKILSIFSQISAHFPEGKSIEMRLIMTNYSEKMRAL